MWIFAFVNVRSLQELFSSVETSTIIDYTKEIRLFDSDGTVLTLGPRLCGKCQPDSAVTTAVTSVVTTAAR